MFYEDESSLITDEEKQSLPEIKQINKPKFPNEDKN